MVVTNMHSEEAVSTSTEIIYVRCDEAEPLDFFYEGSGFIDDRKIYWDNSTQYYCAHKYFVDGETTKQYYNVRNCSHPDQAYHHSFESENFRTDWKEVKEQVMYEALYYRFSQDKRAYEALMDTEGKVIVFTCPNNKVWQGLYSALLIKIREELKQNPPEFTDSDEISNIG